MNFLNQALMCLLAGIIADPNGGDCSCTFPSQFLTVFFFSDQLCHIIEIRIFQSAYDGPWIINAPTVAGLISIDKR